MKNKDRISGKLSLQYYLPTQYFPLSYQSLVIKQVLQLVHTYLLIVTTDQNIWKLLNDQNTCLIISILQFRILQMYHTQGRRSAVKTTSATSEALRLFDRQSENKAFRQCFQALRQNINPCHGMVALVRTAPLSILKLRINLLFQESAFLDQI